MPSVAELLVVFVLRFFMTGCMPRVVVMLLKELGTNQPPLRFNCILNTNLATHSGSKIAA